MLLDATNTHAHVITAETHGTALWLDHFMEDIDYLLCKVFLYLGAVGQCLNHTWDFAEANYVAVWNVGKMAFSEYASPVVSTQTDYLNVMQMDKFIILLVTELFDKKLLRIYSYSRRVFLQGCNEPLRGFREMTCINAPGRYYLFINECLNGVC